MDRISGHLAQTKKETNAYKILVRNPDGRDHLEGVAVDVKIILKWIL
jgi:hypothetical protein